MTVSISEERDAVIDLADELQVRKQTVFKVLKRLGIQPEQRREATRGNQNVATVSLADTTAIKNALRRSDEATVNDAVALPSVGTGSYYSDDVGVFYLIQLEPEHDPTRFKVGFTTELEGRLRKLTERRHNKALQPMRPSRALGTRG
jgi:hypothetical protein